MPAIIELSARLLSGDLNLGDEFEITARVRVVLVKEEIIDVTRISESLPQYAPGEATAKLLVLAIERTP